MRERKIEKNPLEAGREKSHREQEAREKFDHEILRPDHSHDRLKLQRECPDNEIDTGKDEQRQNGAQHEKTRRRKRGRQSYRIDQEDHSGDRESEQDSAETALSDGL